MDVQKIEKRLNGTPLYPFAEKSYRTYLSAKGYINSIRLTGSVFDQSGFYHVTPSESRIDPFYIWLPDAKSGYRRNCITGTLEEPVLSKIADIVEEDDIFWDIGANRGYFSFACANTVKKVVAFEADETSVEIIKRGKEKNDFDNIDIISGYVGEDVMLDSFRPPDLALLDTEGWEYEILKTAPKTLKSDLTWIIEIHPTPEATDEGTPLPPEINPEGVLELFDENGYNVNTIAEYNRGRKHIIAQKS